ncbi:MAG: MFS transporter [Ignavibacteria bacterium]|nr:MFS transporter [Ignavibacteria bacterium]
MVSILAAMSTTLETYKVVSRRLIPMLFISYVISFLDRVNIGYAKLQMATDLGYSDVVYGFGAGIFFIGYFLFEVPSNILLHRLGARIWISRIMITWGIVSGLFAYVDMIPWGPLPAMFGLPDHEFGLYALRFLLGLSEAGFFPGIILYLTYWYPASMRGRTIASFMFGIAVANIIGGPLSGFLMEYLHGYGAWQGWRWLFIIEAIPAVVMGIVLYLKLPNGPREAPWLTASQKQDVLDAVASSQEHTSETSNHSFRQAFSDSRVWMLTFANMLGVTITYAINFWLPTILREIGVGKQDYAMVGIVSLIPWGIGGGTMLFMARNSDRTQERRWHIAGSLLACSVGLLMFALVDPMPVPSIIALTIVTCGTLSYSGLFWSLPTTLLRGTAAVAGIAMINSITNLGGQIGPEIIGRLRSSSYHPDAAFYVLACFTVASALLVVLATRQRKNAG